MNFIKTKMWKSFKTLWETLQFFVEYWIIVGFHHLNIYNIYPPGNCPISFSQPPFLSQWFSLYCLVGYVILLWRVTLKDHYICSDASKDSLFLLVDSKIFISWRWKESLENDLRGFPKPLHLGPSDAWRIQPSKADPSGVRFVDFSFGISNCIVQSGQISSRPHTTKNPKR